MIKNKVQIGNYSTTEILHHGQVNIDRPDPLHAQTKFITTRAVRVGGGYELHRIEKPVVEDKDRIRLLRHLISIKQASKHDLLTRIDFMINENIRLAGFNDTLASKNYEESLLEQQRHLHEIQKVQKEKQAVNELLLKKKKSLTELRSSTDDNILKVSVSLERVRGGLDEQKDRLFELKHFEQASKPKLCIRTQELIDELEHVKISNLEHVQDERVKMERRLKREETDKNERVDRILTRAVDSEIAGYPDRLKTELYLNSQMKFEVEYCKKELETLKMEVQVVQSKINKIPRREITYASIADEIEQSPDVQQIFTFQDEDDEVYTFNIDKKLNLPI